MVLDRGELLHEARLSCQPRVSVIIPLYNKSAHVRDCLDSISRQSLRNLEVICIDDCSEDESASIAVSHARADTRVTVRRNHSNLGPGITRNLGISCASAPYVQFTDADDVLPCQALELLVELASADDVPLVRGSVGRFETNVSDCWFEETQTMPDSHRQPLAHQRKLWLPYFHVCYLFLREFLLTRGICYPGRRSGEDPVFLAKCLINASAISTMSAPSYFYRQQASAYRLMFNDVLSFVEHVKQIKDIFRRSNNSQCWSEECETFFLKDTKMFAGRVASQRSFTEEQRRAISCAMNEIWGAGIDLGDVAL